jgi:predicted DNA-binding protein (MmcQ/YjbR family)
MKRILPRTSGATATGGRSLQLQGALGRLRDICHGLPETVETKTFGHPTFQAGKKRTFAVLDDHEQPGMLCLVVKLEPEEQARLLADEAFFPSKFGAKHGWTAMRVDADTDWLRAKRLVLSSYRLLALKRMLAALDAQEGRQPRSVSASKTTAGSARGRTPD